MNFKSRNIKVFKDSLAIALDCPFKHCQVQYIMYCRNMTRGRSGLFFRDKISMLEWGFSNAFLSQQIFHTPDFNSFRLGKYAVKARAGHIFLLVRKLYSIIIPSAGRKNDRQPTTDTDNQQPTTDTPRPGNHELTTTPTANPDNQQSAFDNRHSTLQQTTSTDK